MTEPVQSDIPESDIVHTSDIVQDGASNGTQDNRSELQALEIRERMNTESRIRTHYYVKVAVSSFMCALLLVIGVPVFMISRMTGSLSYTALGVVLVGFGLILAVAVIVLLFCPPWRKRH